MKLNKSIRTPNNLPPTGLVFVNRVHELEEVTHQLTDPGGNIITISGPAGIGKTSFALRLATSFAATEQFFGGIVWLSCERIDSFSSILFQIAQVVGIDASQLSLGMLRERVLRHLSDAPTLLIFDNYDAVAKDDSILSFIGHLPKKAKVLILSRASIRVPGREYALRLAPFDETVAMEVMRQQLKSSGLAPTDMATMKQIYHQTGGLPLALSLVSGLIKQGMSPKEILGRFQEGTMPDEFVSKFVFDEVYKTLSKEQIQFVEALSTFTSPVDGVTIASIAESKDWRLFIDELVNKTVVDVVDGRYALHPLTRAYFQNRVDRQDLTVYQSRMVQYYLAYITKFKYDFEQIGREWLNIQFAIDTAYQNEQWQAFFGLILNLGQFLNARGYEDAYQKLLAQAIDVSKKIGDKGTQAGLLHNMAVQYQQRGDLEGAIELYKQSLALNDVLHDFAVESATLTNLGSIYRSLGDARNAIGYYERGLAISKQIGDRLGEANILGSLGVSYADLGDYRLATAYYEQSLSISKELGDRRGEANALGNLGAGYADLGDYRLAIAYSEQALTISQEIGDRRAESIYLRNLGAAYQDQYSRTGSADNLDIAIHYLQQALTIGQEIGDKKTEANLFANLGTAYQDQYSRTGSADNLGIAIHYLQQALEFFGVETYPVEYATIQNNLGNIYALLDTGDKTENVEQAIIHYQEAIRVHPPDSPFVASSLNNLGSALSERAQLRGNREDYLQAIIVLQQSLALTPLDSPDWIRVASSIMKAYVKIGNWVEAKKLSIRILERVGTDRDSLETLLPWYEDLGELATKNQDMDFATRIFAEVVRRFEIHGKKAPATINKKLVELREQLGDDRFILIWAEAQGILKPVFAQKLQDARQLMNQELFSEAATKLSEALIILDEMGVAKECDRQRATVFFLRGFCLRKQGFWEEALQDQEHSFRIFENLRDYVGEAHTFLEMGYLFEVMNNYEDARLHYIDAYRLFRRADDKRGMASASENLGRLEYRVRMLSQAIQDLEEAKRLYISIGERTKAAAIDTDLDDAKTSFSYQLTNDNKKDGKR